MVHIRIKSLRENSNLSCKQVAELLSVSCRTYIGYESGARPMPVHKIIKLASFYNTSVDYIVGLSDVNEPYPPTSAE